MKKPHQATCPDCGAQVTITSEQVATLEEFGLLNMLEDEMLCSGCEATAAAKEQNESAKKDLARFLSGIPPEYRTADPSIVCAKYLPAITSKCLRIGLIGTSGSGKSCALACHVKARGESFLWLSANQLREITTKAATEGGHWTLKMDKLRMIPVLAIDDISQPYFTEAFASAFFDVLEHRNSNRLAVLWTSQKPLDALREKIASQCKDADQADAISRRMIDGGIVYETK